MAQVETEQRHAAQAIHDALGVRLFKHPPEGFDPLQRREAAPQEQLVPASPVLIEQQHRLAVGAGPGPQAGGLDLHQRHQAVHLRLGGDQFRQDAAEAERVFAQCRTHPVVAGGGGVALVEDEIDHLEHRGQPWGEVAAPGNLEGNVRFGEGALGPHDALGDGRHRDEEGARDLFGGQAAEQAQREGDPGLGGEHRVASGEHEAQQIVADGIVDGRVEHRDRLLLSHRQLVAELGVFAVEQLVASQQVDRPMLGGGHEPGARVVRHARLRPPLERDDQRVLGQVFGEPDVAHHACQAGDEPGGFDPPDRLDGTMGVGGHGARKLICRTSHSPSHPGQYCVCRRMKARVASTAFCRDAHSSTA